MLADLLRERVGARGSVVGIEESPEMLAVARRNAARQGWSNAFDRPWRHLEHLTEDVRVREVGLGAGYLMTGRVPSRPARSRRRADAR